MASEMYLSLQLNVNIISHTSWRKGYRSVNQTSPEDICSLIFFDHLVDSGPLY